MGNYTVVLWSFVQNEDGGVSRPQVTNCPWLLLSNMLCKDEKWFAHLTWPLFLHLLLLKDGCCDIMWT